MRLLLLILLFSFPLKGQLIIKGGASTFLGDVGGNSGIGSGFLKDFNLKSTGYEIGVGWQYKNWFFEFNYLTLHGADTAITNYDSGNWWRWISRFWFRDKVFELTQMYELNYSGFFCRFGIGEMYFSIKHDTSTYLANIKEKKYSLAQFIIPIVAGYRITENISIQVNYRKTFTDYLDNVSLRGDRHNLDSYFTVDLVYTNKQSKLKTILSKTKCPSFY